MVVRLQSSLGSSIKKVTQDDYNINNLQLARITKVNYQYQTVEFKTRNTYAGSIKDGNSKFSAPLPKSFIGTTPEGVNFGEVPLVTPGSIALVGFINGDGGRPIVLSIYGDSDTNKLITPNPLESGDFSNEDIFKYASSLYKLYPSLTYDFIDGEGSVIKSFNGKTFLSINSNEDEKEQATDFYTGTSYSDLYPSYNSSGELVEPRNQQAPNILFKHQGQLEDNHITMLHINEEGDYRLTKLDTETQKRTTQELGADNSFRVRYQSDSLILDESQSWVEYGIDSESKLFYIKTPNSDFEFSENGMTVNGRPILDNLDDEIDKSAKDLEQIQKDISHIDYLLSGVGKNNIEELIEETKKSIDLSNEVSNKSNSIQQKLNSNIERTEGIIEQFQQFRDKTYSDFVSTTQEILTDYQDNFPTLKQKVNNFNNRIDSIEQSFNSVKASIDDFDTKYSDITESINTYKEQLNTQTNRINSIENELDSIKKSGSTIDSFKNLGYNGSINNLLGFIEKDKLKEEFVTVNYNRSYSTEYKGRTYDINEPIYDLNGLVVRGSLDEKAYIDLSNNIQDEGTCYFTIQSVGNLEDNKDILKLGTLTVGVDSNYYLYIDVNGNMLRYSEQKLNNRETYDLVIKWSNYSNTANLFVNGFNVGFVDFKDYKIPETKRIELNPTFNGVFKKVEIYKKYIKDKYI